MIQPFKRGKAVMGKLIRKLGLAAVIAAGLTLGDAGARDDQAAHAADWRQYASNNGYICEGCCPSTELCCKVDHPCSVTPID
jgi:hypothetical protein